MIKDKYSHRLGFNVDSNLEPIIYYLNKHGVKTFMSCGHGDPNRIILQDKASLDKAAVIFKKINLPKSAGLQFFHESKFTNRKYPMWNIILFRRGYAHVIAKIIGNIQEK
jgi:hypothetical protein